MRKQTWDVNQEREKEEPDLVLKDLYDLKKSKERRIHDRIIAKNADYSPR